MKKRTRLIILLFCVGCFLVLAPVLVAYSMGYRFDFEKMKIVATGGIYVRTFPAAEKIIIDSNISEKPGIFSNSVFVQSLLPKNHTVSIERAGYYVYSKILPVEENQVTKLENVLLFKKEVKFAPANDENQSPFLPKNQPEKFVIKNNNLYYSDTPQNSSLTKSEKTAPLIKNIYTFYASDNNIIWLSSDGFLYKSAVGAKTPEKITKEPVKINKKGGYKIINSGSKIFLNNNGEIFLLNPKKNIFEDFKISAQDLKFSPDGQNMVFHNDSGIYLYSFKENAAKDNIQIFQSKKISACVWLNNDYIVFADGDKIIISEIDWRGGINSITLPVQAKNPSISFNTQEGRLYVLTENNLLVSEKLLP